MTDFSFQLYSARSFPPITFVLDLLRRHGYAQVEGFGGLYDEAQELRELLDKAGLTMPTGHFGLDQLKAKDKARRAADTLGITSLFCPAIPREQWEQAEDDWNRLADELGELGAYYRTRGYRFGWHNHHFEFRPTRSGKLPMNILLDGAPEIDWEMDVAWVVRGGHDPMEWAEKYGNRITAIHVKDLAPAGEAQVEDGWADVGHGIMNWRTLLPWLRSRTGAAHLVMEHDNPSDLERFASRSIRSVKDL